MPHVFVSYARKDISFADNIVQALAERDLDTWIDWKSIPKGEYWEQEIYRGIDEADAFLFLISPDSVQSQMCSKEIARAVKNSKRILPIVIRDTDIANFPNETSIQEISKRNWIFCRDGQDNFTGAIGETFKTIHTDYEWLKYHTRLQVQSLEWQKSNHENSFLLRGKELQDAEFQLATNSSKEPNPTILQREYVLQSRQASDKARRQTTTGLISFSAIVLALLIFSLIQLNISRAQRLASQAQAAFADKNYNAALLYAYQSKQIHENAAANLVLGKLVHEDFPLARALDGHTWVVTSIAWSPDGKQVASGSWDGTVVIWDVEKGQPAFPSFDGQSGPIWSVAWSPDGKYLASGCDNGNIMIWDSKTGKVAFPPLPMNSQVRSVAWSTDGRLASGSVDGTIIIWDLKSGQPAFPPLDGKSDSIWSVAWSPDGKYLASGSNNGTIMIWDSKTGQQAFPMIGNSGAIWSVSWSADGQLAWGSEDGTVTIWNTKTAQQIGILRGHTEKVVSVAWSTDGQLASGSFDNTVILWDLRAGKPAQILRGHLHWVESVAWSTDRRLASGSADQTVMIWDLQPSASAASTITGIPYPVNSVSWSAKGRLAAGEGNFIIRKGALDIWEFGIRGFPPLSESSLINTVAWSKDERLAAGSANGTVTIWDMLTKKPTLPPLDAKAGSVNSVAFSPDGQYLASGSADNSVSIWNSKTGQLVVPPFIYSSSVNSIAWSVDGKLASGLGEGTIPIWDSKTRQTKSLPAYTKSDAAISVAWSIDGQLASGTENGEVIVWDVKTGHPKKILKQHLESVSSVAWSLDGKYLASGSPDGYAIIWDSKTWKPRFKIQESTTAGVDSVAWSPKGQLAVGLANQTIKITRADLSSQDFCETIFRNMTLHEWLIYQGPFYIYQPACSDLQTPNLDPVRNSLNKNLKTDLEFTLYPWGTAMAQNNLLRILLLDLITWPGRVKVLSVVLVLLMVGFIILRMLSKSITWVWSRVRK